MYIHICIYNLIDIYIYVCFHFVKCEYIYIYIYLYGYIDWFKYIYIHIFKYIYVHNYATLPIAMPSPGCVSSSSQLRWCRAPGWWSSQYPVFSDTTTGFWIHFTNSVLLDGTQTQICLYFFSFFKPNNKGDRCTT